MVLNEIIRREEQEESLVLQLKNVPDLVRLSKIEFDIIAYYSEVLNKQAVIQYFSHQVELTEEQLTVLLHLARQKKLLLEVADTTQPRRFQFSLKRRRAIWEVLTVDVSGTRLEQLAESKKTQQGILVLLIGLTVASLLYLLIQPYSFSDSYRQTLYRVPYSFRQVLVLIYLGALVSIGIHELGHFFFYKRCRGVGAVFGLGLVLFIIPIFYNKLPIRHVQKREHRILIYSGGLLFDLLFALCIVSSIGLLQNKSAVLVFVLYSIFISMSIRSIFNLNVFLPYTDGYWILCDCVKKEQLFRASAAVFCRLRKEKMQGSTVLYSVYFLLSCVSIIWAWLFFATPFLVLLYYAGGI